MWMKKKILFIFSAYPYEMKYLVENEIIPKIVQE
jgi:hypothetical protein